MVREKKMGEKLCLKKNHENYMRKLVSDKVVCAKNAVKKVCDKNGFGERLYVRKFCVENGT